ncbi:MAG: phosphate acyltransferase, partial [Acetobacteraceae bacterium]
RDVFAPLVPEYQRLAGRRGIPLETAERTLGASGAPAAAMLVRSGQADAAICGGTSNWWDQVQSVLPIIPPRADVTRVYGLGCLILRTGTLFLCDTHMVVDPTAEQIAEMTILAAEAVENFGIVPKVALLSHSNFGASDSESARKMRRALRLLGERAPKLEVDGEMNGESALVEVIRNRTISDSRLTGSANLLVMPTLDAANIAFTVLKAATEALSVGPMLLGMSKPIHVLLGSVTARGIVNLSALAARQAGSLAD